VAVVACLVAVGAAASGASSAPGGGAAPGASKASASNRYIVIASNKAAAGGDGPHAEPVLDADRTPVRHPRRDHRRSGRRPRRRRSERPDVEHRADQRAAGVDANAGDDDVTVAVADTGLDYTHTELENKVVAVQDFTTNEVYINGESICSPFLASMTPTSPPTSGRRRTWTTTATARGSAGTSVPRSTRTR
jgi:subtilisin family serine protease